MAERPDYSANLRPSRPKTPQAEEPLTSSMSSGVGKRMGAMWHKQAGSRMAWAWGKKSEAPRCDITAHDTWTDFQLPFGGSLDEFLIPWMSNPNATGLDIKATIVYAQPPAVYGIQPTTLPCLTRAYTEQMITSLTTTDSTAHNFVSASPILDLPEWAEAGAQMWGIRARHRIRDWTTAPSDNVFALRWEAKARMEDDPFWSTVGGTLQLFMFSLMVEDVFPIPGE